MAFKGNIYGLSRRFFGAGLPDIGAWLFFSAIFFYGLWGVPTPGDFGFIEGLILCLLSGAFFFSRFFPVFLGYASQPLWFSLALVFLLYGVSVPLAMGLVAGYERTGLLRDLIGFAFLVLPLIYAGLASFKERILGGVLMVGVLFSLRSLAVFPSFLKPAGRLDYLEIAPCILMAALFFGGLSIKILCARFGVAALVRFCVCALLSFLCLMPMMITHQRASLGLWALGMLLVLLISLWFRPRRAAAVCFALALAGWMAADFLSGIVEALAGKSVLVGSNMRWAELAAVWQQIAEHPLTLIFGKGWGVQYASPAVAGLSVNYTHSLLSALLLKSGLLGMMLGAIHVGSVMWVALRNVRSNFVMAVALCCPVLVDVFLYASYKSFDFGLVLALAAWMDMDEEKGTQVIASPVQPL